MQAQDLIAYPHAYYTKGKLDPARIKLSIMRKKLLNSPSIRHREVLRPIEREISNGAFNEETRSREGREEEKLQKCELSPL
jgi:hypothetical protein